MAKQRAPKVKRINISAIRVSAAHWKRDLSKQDIEEMADAMAERGQLSMPIVRPSPRAANFYELLAGRKRLEAAKLNRMPTINCYVVEADDKQARIISLEENLLQAKLTGAERTWAIGELHDLLEETQGIQQRGRPESKPKKVGGTTKIPRPKAKRDDVVKRTKLSRDTVRKDVKRYKSLSKRAAAAYQAGAISTKQADILADMSQKAQDKELAKMREENYLETKTRIEEQEKQAEFDKAKENAPVSARKMLRALNKRVREEINPELSKILQFMQEYEVETTADVPHIEELGEYINTLWELLG